MARDVFAVPATGAGVECQFSKSGRIATWTRALLHPDTFRDIMMYKDYLSRTAKPLIHGRRGIEIYDDGDSKGRDEDPEESAKMIEWEMEWWQKLISYENCGGYIYFVGLSDSLASADNQPANQPAGQPNNQTTIASLPSHDICHYMTNWCYIILVHDSLTGDTGDEVPASNLGYEI